MWCYPSHRDSNSQRNVPLVPNPLAVNDDERLQTETSNLAPGSLEPYMVCDIGANRAPNSNPKPLQLPSIYDKVSLPQPPGDYDIICSTKVRFVYM